MFFDNLDKTELELIEKIGVMKKYQKDAFIIEEGMQGSSFGVILSGRVEVRKRIRGGEFKALVQLKPFDLIGELGFFGAACRSASVIAVEPSSILSFEHDIFHALATNRPRIGMVVYYNMARILAERLVSNNVNLMDTIIWALGHAPGPRTNVSKRMDWAG